MLAAKKERSTAQILSSIKKRRLNTGERLKGDDLSNLADKIIE